MATFTAVDPAAAQPISLEIPIDSTPVERKIDWDKCPVIRGLKKVWEAVKDFFIRTFECCVGSSDTLSEKEIEWLKAAKKSISASNSPQGERTEAASSEKREKKRSDSVKRLKSKLILPIRTKGEAGLEGTEGEKPKSSKRKKVVEGEVTTGEPVKDPVEISMEEASSEDTSLSFSPEEQVTETFRETGYEFVQKTVDLYFTKVVLPKFNKEETPVDEPPKEGETGTTEKPKRTIDSIFEFITENINKVTQLQLQEDTLSTTVLLFDQYQALFAPLIGTLESLEASDIISSDKQPEIFNLIQWAIGKNKRLNKALVKYLKNIHGEECAQKLVDWLYGDLKLSPIVACEGVPRDKVISAFKDAICYLAIKQIETFKERVSVIESEFPEFGEAFFKNNANRIGTQIVDRVVSLVEHLDYPKMYKELLVIMNNQSQAIIKTEEAREEAIAKEKQAHLTMKKMRQTAIAGETLAVNKATDAAAKAEATGNALIQKANAFDPTIEHPPGSPKAIEKEALISFNENHPEPEDKAAWCEEKTEESRKKAFLSEKKGRVSWLKEDNTRTEEQAYALYKNNPDEWIAQAGRAAAKESYLAYLETTLFLNEKVKEALKSAVLKGSPNEKAAQKAQIRQEVKVQLFVEAEQAQASDNASDREEWLKNIGESSAQGFYKALPICHKKIESARTEEVSVTPKDKHWAIKTLEAIQVVLMYTSKKSKPKPLIQQEEKEPHFFEPFAKDVVESLFPKEKVHKQDDPLTEYPIEGVLSLLDQLEYPKQITDLYEEGLYIYQKIVTDENRDTVKLVCEALHDLLYENMEANVVAYLKDLLKYQVEEVLTSLFKQLTVPESLDEMVITTILPAIQEMLLASLARQMLTKETSKYAALFFSGSSEEDITQLKGDLKQALRGALKQTVIEDTAFDKTFDTLVQEIQGKLTAFEEANTGASSLQRTKAALELYLKEVEDAGDIPLYGDLTVNLVLKIGKFSSAAETLSGYLKGMLSQQITAAMSDVQESPYYLLSRATEKIKNDYLSDEAISELFSLDKTETEKAAPKPKLDLEELEGKKTEEIAKTGQIAHDLFMHIASQQNIFIRKPMQWVVGNDSTHLTSVLTRISQQLLGDRLRMENLVVQTQEVIFSALKESAHTIAADTASREVKRLPTLLPGFIYGDTIA